jgi:hypothetical protein
LKRPRERPPRIKKSCLGKTAFFDRYCGFFVIAGGAEFEFIDFIVFLISGGSFDESTGCVICFFIVAASGIPGIFSPGFIVRTAFLGLIPGVGVAPGGTLVTEFASGIPGVVFADGGTGEVDIPGGSSAAFALVMTLPLRVDVFAVGVDPQAMLSTEIERAKNIVNAFAIYR